MALLAPSDERLSLTDAALLLAKGLENKGLRGMDALHLAIVEVAKCDVLLTTDDQLIRRVRDLSPALEIVVENPARWVLENPDDDS